MPRGGHIRMMALSARLHGSIADGAAPARRAGVALRDPTAHGKLIASVRRTGVGATDG